MTCMSVTQDVLDKRKKMFDDFDTYRQQLQKVWNEQKNRRLELRQSEMTFTACRIAISLSTLFVTVLTTGSLTCRYRY